MSSPNFVRTFKRLFLPLVATVILLGIFIGLGIWQLERANDVTKLQKPFIEQKIISLRDLTSPGINLDASAVNRIVRADGKYVDSFIAPNQKSRGGVTTWNVSLLELTSSPSEAINKSAILVVRSNESASSLPAGSSIEPIQITGRLFPRQSDDRAETAPGVLARIDPAIVVGAYSGVLFDGFIVVNEEVLGEKVITASRVEVDIAKPTVTGYYWQHISYVVIWWLMALLVLFLPFYQRYQVRNAGNTGDAGDTRESSAIS